VTAPKSLSIVIPAFNEERFIAQLVAKVQAVDLSLFGLAKEIIVVSDGSTDRTAEIVEGIAGVHLIRMIQNSGKGAAVRAGIEATTGDLIMIQDADLEYEPDDYQPMIADLLRSGADAVYGSRYMRQPGAGAGRRTGQTWSAYLGGRSLSVVQWWFTRRYLTDTVTALKLFHGPIIRELTLVTTGFELDHEITSKLLARGRTIREVPIRYYPRSRKDGKKIGFRDWLIAVRTYARHSGSRLLGFGSPPWRLLAALAIVAALLFGSVQAWPVLKRRFGPRPQAVPAVRTPVGEIRQIAERLYLIPGSGGNTAVFVTAAGPVVVDAKFPEDGAAVLAQIRTVTPLPVVHAISTHSHSDHFGGILAMPVTTRVVLQANTARNIAKLRGTGDAHSLEGRPVQTFDDRLTLLDGVEAVDLYWFGPAHTSGDTFVVFREAGVMHAGDVFPDRAAPIVNLAWGGDPRTYAATMSRAIGEIHGVTRVITGHGDVLSWDDFVQYAGFNRLLLEHVKKEMDAGHDWKHARDSFVLPETFKDYQLTRLPATLQDMYKGLTPWWHFW
jgi:glycosyltransferase involved in cell wall biosynthesis/glyoxylase-like metal-dependent hydrolase (beta-lactamase superfamily II)